MLVGDVLPAAWYSVLLSDVCLGWPGQQAFVCWMSRIEVRWSNLMEAWEQPEREAGVSGKKFLLFCPFRHVSIDVTDDRREAVIEACLRPSFLKRTTVPERQPCRVD
jgi:hypothetical protein